MSWGGNGGFFGSSAGVRPQAPSAIVAATPRNTVAMAPLAKLDDLRDIARDAYAKGRLTGGGRSPIRRSRHGQGNRQLERQTTSCSPA